MQYTHTSLATLKTLLATRLGDAGSAASKVTWTDAAGHSELGLYLKEACRTFQGLTSFFRLRSQAVLSAGVNFYDLPTLFPNELAYTVVDQELIGLIQYHLYEPYSVLAWTGGEQFTLTDLVNALSRARNHFLDDTGIILTRKNPFAVGAGAGLVDVGAALNSDRIIDIMRAQWIDPSNRYYNVWRSDEIYADSLRAKWTLYPGIPYGFSIFGAPPLSVQLTPPPINNGKLELVIIEGGVTLDPTANTNAGTLLAVPDNYASAVKWGAVADLLSREGPAKDPFRADLAKKLYSILIGMAMNTRVIVNAELDGRPVKPDTLFALDAAHQGWEGLSTGAPADLAVMSHNLIAVRPAPDSSPHTLSGNLVVNASFIIPSADAGFVQVGRELIETLLDYAEFLAVFKLGGEESKGMSVLLERFLASCASYNSKLAGAIKAAEATMVPQRQRIEVPRRKMPRALQDRI